MKTIAYISYDNNIRIWDLEKTLSDIKDQKKIHLNKKKESKFERKVQGWKKQERKPKKGSKDFSLHQIYQFYPKIYDY